MITDEVEWSLYAYVSEYFEYDMLNVAVQQNRNDLQYIDVLDV